MNLLSAQQLGQLVPLAPTLMAWLRQVDRRAGDLFLQDSSMNALEVQQTLRELLNALNYNGDLTMVQFRYILNSHDPSVWASATRLILANSAPRLVSDQIGNSLVAALPKLDGAENASDCCKIIGPYLDMMPRSNYQALGDFCALLRDHSDDAASLACLVGPLLLTVGVAQGARVPQVQTAAAAAVMDLLIEECEPIFGRSAARSRADAFGVRPVAPARNVPRSAQQSKQSQARAPPPPPGTPVDSRGGRSPAGGSKKDARGAKRKQQLRAFYQWRDPSRAEKVDMLLENHAFQDVAKAVYRKYGMLPPGWRVDLEELQREKGITMDWFTQASREGNARRSMNPSVSGFVAPQVPDIKHEPAKPATNNMDRVIDEIADTEQVYHDKLSHMLEGFVKEMRIISSGQRGKAAADGLGLSLAQVEQIFGWRLDEIINVSNNLLSKLEVVTLVRTDPKTGKTRVGLVANAFNEIATELHVYAPYVSSHSQSAVQLDKSMRELQSAPKGRFNNKKADCENWVQLWERFSKESEHLRGHSVSSLLIEPVQRVPRYRLLLGSLKKEMPDDHKAFKDVVKAHEAIGAAAGQINEALKQHQRLAKLLGDDHMPTPGGSTNKPAGVKGKKKIVNNYS